VRAREAIPRGAFVCEYAGEVLSVDTHLEREEEEGRGEGKGKRRETVVLDATRLDSLDDGRVRGVPLVLETTDLGNVARFIRRP